MDMRDELLTLLQLKDIPRTGWVRSGVDNPESVAAHSWGMAVLALRLCPGHLDLCKVLSMCLVHDVAEIVVGDLTPHDAIQGQEKHDLERAGMLKIAPQWIDLFDEYEQGTSDEARFVKTMDKLDMGLQAMHYQQQGLDLNEFITSARSKTDRSAAAQWRRRWGPACRQPIAAHVRAASLSSGVRVPVLLSVQPTPRRTQRAAPRPCLSKAC